MLFAPEPLRPRAALALELWSFTGGEFDRLPFALAWYGVSRGEEIEAMVYLFNVIRRAG
jgi:hypothetical protein